MHLAIDLGASSGKNQISIGINRILSRYWILFFWRGMHPSMDMYVANFSQFHVYFVI